MVPCEPLSRDSRLIPGGSSVRVEIVVIVVFVLVIVIVDFEIFVVVVIIVTLALLTRSVRAAAGQPALFAELFAQDLPCCCAVGEIQIEFVNQM